MTFLTDEQFVGILDMDSDILNALREHPAIASVSGTMGLSPVAIPLLTDGPETFTFGSGAPGTDFTGNWETTQVYAAEGRLLIAVAGDGHLDIDGVQRLANRELALWADCFHGVDISAPEGRDLRSAILAGTFRN